MAWLAFVLFAILAVCTQGVTFFVSTNGSDNGQCGSEMHPCASINQVVVNNPNGSYTVSIADGSYPTSNLDLSNLSVVSFQGNLNTVINASWTTGLFIVNGPTSAFEFHNVTLVLSGDGFDFTTILNENNAVGFYNVKLIYSNYSGNFVEIDGGSLVVSNCTLDGASFNTNFIIDTSDQLSSNITLSYSTFSNLDIKEAGTMIEFEALGPAIVVVDNTVFTNISADYKFIAFFEHDKSQQFTISNSLFSNLFTAVSSVYIEPGTGGVTHIQNSTWNNVSSAWISGALESLSPSDDVAFDNVLILDQLTFINCSGPLSGAVLVGYNTLTLSNSTFSGNIGDQYASDVVQVLGAASESFPYVITNSYSSSATPKAVVYNIDRTYVIDISDQLPNPSNEHDSHPHPHPKDSLTPPSPSFISPSTSPFPSPSSKHTRVDFKAKRTQLRKDGKKKKEALSE